MAENEENCSDGHNVTCEELTIVKAVKVAYDNAVTSGYAGTPEEWFAGIIAKIPMG